MSPGGRDMYLTLLGLTSQVALFSQSPKLHLADKVSSHRIGTAKNQAAFSYYLFLKTMRVTMKFKKSE